MNNGDTYEGRHTMSFSKTTLVERMRAFVAYLPREIPLFATVTISFWGVADVLAKLGGERLSLKNLAAPALVTASAVAAYKSIKKYRSRIPEALLTESAATHIIYRKGALGWQFGLAWQMLRERTEVLERKLSRLESGAYFVRPEHLNAESYIAWLVGRPQILLRLIRAVAIQCIHEIPSILADVRGQGNLRQLKESVDQLAALYSEAVEFEQDSRRICAPTEFSDLHEMIFGWSKPIRQGILEFLGVLRSLSLVKEGELKKGAVASPTFDIRFDPPSNVEEFEQRLEALAP